MPGKQLNLDFSGIPEPQKILALCDELESLLVRLQTQLLREMELFWLHAARLFPALVDQEYYLAMDSIEAFNLGPDHYDLARKTLFAQLHRAITPRPAESRPVPQSVHAETPENQDPAPPGRLLPRSAQSVSAPDPGRKKPRSVPRRKPSEAG